MKKLIPILVLAALALASTPACSSSSANAPADAPATEEVQVTEPAEPAEPATTAETAPGDVLPNDGTRKIGEVTTCAVSGDVFTITEETPKAEYEGGTYYFCCQGCAKSFRENPEEFTQAQAPGAGGEAETAP